MNLLVKEVRDDISEFTKLILSHTSKLDEKKREIDNYESEARSFYQFDQIIIPAYNASDIRNQESDAFRPLKRVLDYALNEIDKIGRKAESFDLGNISTINDDIYTVYSNLISLIGRYNYGEKIYDYKQKLNSLASDIEFNKACLDYFEKLITDILNNPEEPFISTISTWMAFDIQDSRLQDNLSTMQNLSARLRNIANQYEKNRKAAEAIGDYLITQIYSNSYYDRSAYNKFFTSVSVGTLPTENIPSLYYDYTPEEIAKIVKSAGDLFNTPKKKQLRATLLASIKREFVSKQYLETQNKELGIELANIKKEFLKLADHTLKALTQKDKFLSASKRDIEIKIKKLLDDKNVNNDECLTSIDKAYSLIYRYVKNYNASLNTFKEKLMKKCAELRTAFKEEELSTNRACMLKVNEKADALSKNKKCLELNDLYNNYMNYFDWKKNTIREEEYEDVLLGWYLKAVSKNSESLNTYTEQYLDLIKVTYSMITKSQDGKYYFRMPLLLNLKGIGSNRSNIIVDMEPVPISDNAFKELRYNFFRNIVTSLMQNIPAGKSDFRFFIPKSTDMFSMFNRIGADEGTGRAYVEQTYEGSKISEKLFSIRNMIAERSSSVLVTGKSLFEVNTSNSNSRVPYTFLFLADYPEDLNEKDIENINYICTQGPRCGVYAFIFNNRKKSINSLFSDDVKLKSNGQEYIKQLITLSGKEFYLKDEDQNCKLEPYGTIEIHLLKSFVEKYNKAIKTNRVVRYYYDKIK